jgi:signal transduction histidine kinase/ligand-binding sensor domain-containing protein
MRPCPVSSPMFCSQRTHNAIMKRAKPDGTQWLLLVLSLALYGLLQSSNVRALELDRSISQFHHTSWTMAENAPVNIWAIAQAPDGRLWLGTGGGLYRFDGLTFDRIQPAADEQFRSNDITALLAPPSGELWIGFSSGGISLLKDGHFVNYTERDGIPAGWVTSIARGPDGTIWASAQSGLARFAAGRWQTVGADWGYPAGSADWVLVDSDGTVWVATALTLVYLKPGSKTFTSTGEQLGHWAVLAQAPDGTRWMSDDRNGTRPFPTGGAIRAGPATTVAKLPVSKRMMFDRDGALWATNARTGGLFRISDAAFLHAPQPHLAQAAIDLYTQEAGLTSNVAVPVFEDREGNIWVGTNGGLNRFRYAPIVPARGVSTASYTGYWLAATSGRDIWVATTYQLFRVDEHSARNILDISRGTVSSYGAPDGTLWLATPDQLLHFGRGGVAAIALPAAAKKGMHFTIAADRDGPPWISLDDSIALRFDERTWVPYAGHAVLPTKAATAAASGEAGEVWFGYEDGSAVKLTSSDTSLYTRSDGLNIGSIWAISVSGRQVIFGGENGLAILEGGRIRSVTASKNEVLAGVSGVTQTSSGDVWLTAQRGLVRVSTVDLNRAIDDPNAPFRFELFDAQDGLPGPAQEGGPSSLIRASDSRLWLATSGGVAWIDLARKFRSSVSSPVVIRSLSSRNQQYSPEGIVRLPKRSVEVEINYASVSLTDPGRTQFRYKLDGFDDDWRNVGTRRVAFYTGLRPGTYQFHVAAADNIYSPFDSDATLTFSIAASFYQMFWFRVLCAIGAAAVLWLFYRLHLRRVASQIRGRLEERISERGRIARELHDTLLQSSQGLILMFQGFAGRLSSGDSTRREMEAALDQADELLNEARSRVGELRTTETNGDLTQAIARLGAELFSDGTTFQLLTAGVPRVLGAPVSGELYLIIREALTNARRHAQASVVEAEIEYGPSGLRVRIRDDGKGVDESLLRDGAHSGHFGLQGMRERARQIGASFDIWSGRGAGIEIEVIIPALTAYGSGQPLRGWIRRFGASKLK